MNQTSNDSHEVESEIFVVGDLRVDIGQQRVMRSGTEITLPNLSFQLLVALIRGAPNVLSHDVLMARVWPGMIVSPETINKRANLLREALGDDAKEPRYISGVRSRGYRLVAEVSRAETRAPTPSATATPQIESSTQDRATSDAQGVPAKQGPRRWLGVSAVVVVALVAGFIVRTYISNHRPGAVIRADNPPAADALTVTRARTVAVLPFENISADTADAYLARGLPEMVLDRLSRVAGLAVIARNSSFALNTTSIDSQEIGRRLNCGYLINGSVQRKADRLRVAVQLVDTSAGTLVWAANFDRTLSDIFSVEDEIADQVTGALSARLGGLAPSPAAQMRSGNVEAYLAYLRGRTLLGRFSVAESESAIPYFEKAIALDPNFAAAYASLYDARLQAAHLRHEDLAQVRLRFRSLIDRALAIDPNSGASFFARAMWADTPFEARNADFLRGVALDPSNGRGLTAYAEFLDYEDFGWVQAAGSSTSYPVQREAAKRILQRALQIDPMSPGAHFDAATGALDEVGAAALEQNMIAVLELDPDFVPALFQVAKYRAVFHGKLADAVQILEHAIALDPRNPEPRQIAKAVYLDLGDEQAARAMIGMPQGAHDPFMLMYAGDWRAAGRAAYDAGSGDDCDAGSANKAVRDYALKTGELSRAVAFIKATPYYEGNLAAHLGLCNIESAIMLSQLLDAQGHASDAQALRRDAVSWLNANGAKYESGSRGLAEALMLDGRTDKALDTLAEDFRTGDYRGWWYTLKYDSLWLPLHGDPRFQAIVKDVQRYVDAQRKQLEELRRRGIVPPALRPGDFARQPGIK
jgi:TolB-like protein/DNA-binding winged helix-turn-helix (wHTH) protein